MDAYVKSTNANDVAMFLKGSYSNKTKGRVATRIFAQICWHLLHLVFTICVCVAFIYKQVKSFLFAPSLKEYKALEIKKPQTVGIVVDSKEAGNQLFAVCKVIQWLADIGVQHVALYDVEGVLKHSKTIFQKILNALNLEIQISNPSMLQNHKNILQTSEKPCMTVELLSFSDGKEGIAKAARYICADTFQKANKNNQDHELRLTESDIDRGLEATGCAGPEPDLILVFGFARCLLGFPAWRIRFTEIMYMGMLKSVSLKSMLSALGQFSKKDQRYGK